MNDNLIADLCELANMMHGTLTSDIDKTPVQHRVAHMLRRVGLIVFDHGMDGRDPGVIRVIGRNE